MVCVFCHRLAPYSPCNSWAICIMRKDARWGSDGWVSVLSLPHTSCVALRCYFLLDFNFLILKRRNWFIPGINNLFFAKGQIIHMSGLVGHLICVDILYCIVQKQNIDNLDAWGGAPIKLHLKTLKLEFYITLTYHEVLFFWIFFNLLRITKHS